jgi:hypothetical protein
MGSKTGMPVSLSAVVAMSRTLIPGSCGVSASALLRSAIKSRTNSMRPLARGGRLFQAGYPKSSSAIHSGYR